MEIECMMNYNGKYYAAFNVGGASGSHIYDLDINPAPTHDGGMDWENAWGSTWNENRDNTFAD